MDVGADGRTDRQLKPALLDRLCRRVDLKKYSIVHATTNKKYRSYHLQQCGHGPRCSAVQPHLGRTAPQRPHTTCTSPDRQWHGSSLNHPGLCPPWTRYRPPCPGKTGRSRAALGSGRGSRRHGAPGCVAAATWRSPRSSWLPAAPRWSVPAGWSADDHRCTSGRPDDPTCLPHHHLKHTHAYYRAKVKLKGANVILSMVWTRRDFFPHIAEVHNMWPVWYQTYGNLCSH